MLKQELFTYQGQKHPYYIVGEGKTHVLVLHGWGSQIASWETFFDVENQDKYTFYFPELPGFGDSPPPKEAWDVDSYTDYVQAFHKSLKPKPDFLLTHSLGGRIAIKWLSKKPKTFKHAILVAAAGIKPKKSFLKRLVEKLASSLKKYEDTPILSFPLSILKKITIKLLRAQDYQKTQGLMKQTFLNVVDEDLTPLLSKIKTPVELVWGKNDAYTPLYMGRIMNQEIPNSHLTIIKEARHGVHMQEPAKLASILDLITQ